jgi:hypothetical protein
MDAIRRGVGVRESAWPIPGALLERERADLAATILEWVRESMAGMRRPYGVDHVALAIACRDADGRLQCSRTLGVIRPGAFYSDDGPARIRAFLDDLESVPAGRRADIAAALLRVGDLAYELGVAA